MDDEDLGPWQADDENERSTGWVNKEKSLFDVEEYLSGILWNLQVMLCFALFLQPTANAWSVSLVLLPLFRPRCIL